MKLFDAWTMIGEWIKIENEDEVENGVYTIVEVSDGVVTLYNVKTNKTVHLYEDEKEYQIQHVPLIEKIEMLLEFYAKQVITLSSEHWSKGGPMDITPYLTKVENITTLLNILEARKL